MIPYSIALDIIIFSLVTFKTLVAAPAAESNVVAAPKNKINDAILLGLVPLSRSPLLKQPEEPPHRMAYRTP